MNFVGHVGGALVLISLVLSMLDEPAALWFLAVSVPTSLLPDIDLYLPYFPHQGVVHTYPVMLLVSVAGGLIAVGLFAAIGGVREGDSDGRSIDLIEPFELTTGALVLGTFTHITLDVVAYQESFTTRPVEPLWPFTDWVPRINVFPPEAVLWNYGFLALGVGTWIVVYAVKFTGAEHTKA